MVRAPCIALALFLWPCAALADDDITGMIDAALMGDLDQHDLTVCKTKSGASLACGPAAAVNSFVYLEHRYPRIYHENLVLLTPSQASGQEAAGNVLGKDYMNSTERGTFWTDFFKGKQSYIDDKAPGTTRSTEQTAPGAGWIADGLNDNADVELKLDFGTGTFLAHFVTATRITYDSLFGLGTLYFVDPLDGKVHSADISSGDNGLSVTYTRPDTKEVLHGRITHGARESPIAGVPEPGTWAMMLAGLLIAGQALRGLSAARRARPPNGPGPSLRIPG